MQLLQSEDPRISIDCWTWFLAFNCQTSDSIHVCGNTVQRETDLLDRFWKRSCLFLCVCVSSSQVWSVCLRRSIWLPLCPNIWLNSTTTAHVTVTTHMWSTNAQQNTLSTDDTVTQLSTHTLNIISIIITMTTSMESCRGNTSADAASNVCKGTLNSLYLCIYYIMRMRIDNMLDLQ